MSCSNPESLGRLIYLTAQEVKNFAEKLLKPYDLTLEQFHLLNHMSLDSGMSNDKMIQNAISQRLMITIHFTTEDDFFKIMG